MEVDEKLLKKINRNLRAVKFMLSTLFLLFFAIIAVLGFIAYKVVTFTNDVNTKITNIENTTTEKLDVKSELCEGATGSIANQFCN
jgi:predicted PurR-regulated permease PerM